MEISFKHIVSIISFIGVLGLSYALFRFIIIRFFQNILSTQDELIQAKNTAASKLTGHCERLKNIEEDIRDIKTECRAHATFRKKEE